MSCVEHEGGSTAQKLAHTTYGSHASHVLHEAPSASVAESSAPLHCVQRRWHSSAAEPVQLTLLPGGIGRLHSHGGDGGDGGVVQKLGVGDEGGMGSVHSHVEGGDDGGSGSRSRKCSQLMGMYGEGGGSAGGGGDGGGGDGGGGDGGGGIGGGGDGGGSGQDGR